MGSLLVELLPSGFGLAITPTAIATGILFLSSNRPIANAIAFAAPFALVYTAFATVVLVAAGVSDEPLLGDRTKRLITLAVGLLLLSIAVVSWLRGRRPHPVRESKLMAEVENANPPTAFLTGLLLAVLNPNVPILLAGLAAIAAADVSTAGQVGAAALLVGASEVGLLGPVLWYVSHPESAARGLGRLKGWLSRHEHAVDLAVLVFFGLVFTLKGLAGL